MIKLFDFEATTRGAEWIDEIARQAQEIKLGIAYAARCEHALNPNETTYPEGSCRSFLAQYKSRCDVAE